VLLVGAIASLNEVVPQYIVEAPVEVPAAKVLTVSPAFAYHFNLYPPYRALAVVSEKVTSYPLIK